MADNNGNNDLSTEDKLKQLEMYHNMNKNYDNSSGGNNDDDIDEIYNEYVNYQKEKKRWKYDPEAFDPSVKTRDVGNEAEYERLGIPYKFDSQYTADQMWQAQSAWEKAGNAAYRFGWNTLYDTVGGIGSMVDPFDYYNTDDEVGNILSDWAAREKEKTNKAAPIYKPTDAGVGNFAWWMENGSALASSIAAFGIQGMGVGAVFKGIGAARMLGKLAKTGRFGKAAMRGTDDVLGAASKIDDVGATAVDKFWTAGRYKTLENAAGAADNFGAGMMLNQAESIMTASELYNSTYQDALNRGYDPEYARKVAANAATHSINLNRANMLLNIESTNMFMKGMFNMGSIKDKITMKSIFKKAGTEGIKEAGEELVNLFAEKQGSEYGKQLLDEADARNRGQRLDTKPVTSGYKSLGDSYSSIDLSNPFGDATFKEGFETALLGALGGMGQTGLVSTALQGKGSYLLDKIPAFGGKTLGDRLGLMNTQDATYTENQYYADGSLKAAKGDRIVETQDAVYKQDVLDDDGNVINKKGDTKKIVTQDPVTGETIEEVVQEAKLDEKGKPIVLKVGQVDEMGNKVDGAKTRKFSYNDLYNFRLDEQNDLLKSVKDQSDKMSRMMGGAKVQAQLERTIYGVDTLVTQGKMIDPEDKKAIHKDLASLELLSEGDTEITDEKIEAKSKEYDQLNEKQLRKKQDELMEMSLANKSLEAFELGTQDVLENTFKELMKLKPEEAKAKGYGPDYKEQASKALDKIKYYENMFKEYNFKHTPEQARRMFLNRIKRENLGTDAFNLNKEAQDLHDNEFEKYSSENNKNPNELDTRKKYDEAFELEKERQNALIKSKELKKLNENKEKIEKEMVALKSEVKAAGTDKVKLAAIKTKSEEIVKRYDENQKSIKENEDKINNPIDEKIKELGLKEATKGVKSQAEIHARKMAIMNEARRLDKEFDKLRSKEFAEEINKIEFEKYRKGIKNQIYKETIAGLLRIQNSDGLLVYQLSDDNIVEGKLEYKDGKYYFVTKAEKRIIPEDQLSNFTAEDPSDNKTIDEIKEKIVKKKAQIAKAEEDHTKASNISIDTITKIDNAKTIDEVLIVNTTNKNREEVKRLRKSLSKDNDDNDLPLTEAKKKIINYLRDKFQKDNWVDITLPDGSTNKVIKKVNALENELKQLDDALKNEQSFYKISTGEELTEDEGLTVLTNESKTIEVTFDNLDDILSLEKEQAEKYTAKKQLSSTVMDKLARINRALSDKEKIYDELSSNMKDTLDKDKEYVAAINTYNKLLHYLQTGKDLSDPEFDNIPEIAVVRMHQLQMLNLVNNSITDKIEETRKKIINIDKETQEIKENTEKAEVFIQEQKQIMQEEKKSISELTEQIKRLKKAFKADKRKDLYSDEGRKDMIAKLTNKLEIARNNAKSASKFIQSTKLDIKTLEKNLKALNKITDDVKIQEAIERVGKLQEMMMSINEKGFNKDFFKLVNDMNAFITKKEEITNYIRIRKVQKDTLKKMLDFYMKSMEKGKDITKVLEDKKTKSIDKIVSIIDNLIDTKQLTTEEANRLNGIKNLISSRLSKLSSSDDIMDSDIIEDYINNLYTTHKLIDKADFTKLISSWVEFKSAFGSEQLIDYAREMMGDENLPENYAELLTLFYDQSIEYIDMHDTAIEQLEEVNMLIDRLQDIGMSTYALLDINMARELWGLGQELTNKLSKSMSDEEKALSASLGNSNILDTKKLTTEIAQVNNQIAKINKEKNEIADKNVEIYKKLHARREKLNNEAQTLADIANADIKTYEDLRDKITAGTTDTIEDEDDNEFDSDMKVIMDKDRTLAMVAEMRKELIELNKQLSLIRSTFSAKEQKAIDKYNAEYEGRETAMLNTFVGNNIDDFDDDSIDKMIDAIERIKNLKSIQQKITESRNLLREIYSRQDIVTSDPLYKQRLLAKKNSEINEEFQKLLEDYRTKSGGWFNILKYFDKELIGETSDKAGYTFKKIDKATGNEIVYRYVGSYKTKFGKRMIFDVYENGQLLSEQDRVKIEYLDDKTKTGLDSNTFNFLNDTTYNGIIKYNSNVKRLDKKFAPEQELDDKEFSDHDDIETTDEFEQKDSTTAVTRDDKNEDARKLIFTSAGKHLKYDNKAKARIINPTTGLAEMTKNVHDLRWFDKLNELAQDKDYADNYRIQIISSKSKEIATQLIYTENGLKGKEVYGDYNEAPIMVIIDKDGNMLKDKDNNLIFTNVSEKKKSATANQITYAFNKYNDNLVKEGNPKISLENYRKLDGKDKDGVDNILTRKIINDELAAFRKKALEMINNGENVILPITVISPGHEYATEKASEKNLLSLVNSLRNEGLSNARIEFKFGKDERENGKQLIKNKIYLNYKDSFIQVTGRKLNNTDVSTLAFLFGKWVNSASIQDSEISTDTNKNVNLFDLITNFIYYDKASGVDFKNYQMFLKDGEFSFKPTTGSVRKITKTELSTLTNKNGELIADSSMTNSQKEFVKFLQSMRRQISKKKLDSSNTVNVPVKIENGKVVMKSYINYKDYLLSDETPLESKATIAPGTTSPIVGRYVSVDQTQIMGGKPVVSNTNENPEEEETDEADEDYVLERVEAVGSEVVGDDVKIGLSESFLIGSRIWKVNSGYKNNKKYSAVYVVYGTKAEDTDWSFDKNKNLIEVNYFEDGVLITDENKINNIKDLFTNDLSTLKNEFKIDTDINLTPRLDQNRLQVNTDAQVVGVDDAAIELFKKVKDWTKPAESKFTPDVKRKSTISFKGARNRMKKNPVFTKFLPLINALAFDGKLVMDEAKDYASFDADGNVVNIPRQVENMTEIDALNVIHELTHAGTLKWLRDPKNHSTDEYKRLVKVREVLLNQILNDIKNPDSYFLKETGEDFNNLTYILFGGVGFGLKKAEVVELIDKFRNNEITSDALIKELSKGMKSEADGLIELVSFAMSNKEFQEKLNSMKLSEEDKKVLDTKAKNLWQYLFDMFKNMFGITVKDGAMLKEVLEATADVMQNLDKKLVSGITFEKTDIFGDSENNKSTVEELNDAFNEISELEFNFFEKVKEVADELLKNIQFPENKRISNNWIAEKFENNEWISVAITTEEAEMYFGKDVWKQVNDAHAKWKIERNKLDEEDDINIEKVKSRQSDFINNNDTTELRRSWSLGKIPEENIIGIDSEDYITENDDNTYSIYYYSPNFTEDTDQWTEEIIGNSREEVIDKVNAKYDAELKSKPQLPTVDEILGLAPTSDVEKQINDKLVELSNDFRTMAFMELNEFIEVMVANNQQQEALELLNDKSRTDFFKNKDYDVPFSPITNTQRQTLSKISRSKDFDNVVKSFTNAFNDFDLLSQKDRNSTIKTLSQELLTYEKLFKLHDTLNSKYKEQLDRLVSVGKMSRHDAYNELLSSLFEDYLNGDFKNIDKSVLSLFDDIALFYDENIKTNKLQEHHDTYNLLSNQKDDSLVYSPIMDTKITVEGVELTQEESTAIMNGMTAMMFEELKNKDADVLFAENIEWFDVYKNIRKRLNEDISKKLRGILNALESSGEIIKKTYGVTSKEWKEFLSLSKNKMETYRKLDSIRSSLFLESKGDKEWIKAWKRHADRMRSYGIKYDVEELLGEDETESVRDREFNKSQGETNEKDNIPAAVRLWIASRSKSTTERNILNFPVLLDFNDSYNYIIGKLAGLPADPDIMLEKLNKVLNQEILGGKTFKDNKELNNYLNSISDYKRYRYELLKSILEPGNVFEKAFTQDGTFYDRKLLSQITQTFGKQKPKFVLGQAKENGDIFYYDSNQNKTSDLVLNEWSNNYKSKFSNRNLTIVDFKEVLEAIKNFNSKSPSDYRYKEDVLDPYFKTLNNIGISFTDYDAANSVVKNIYGESIVTMLQSSFTAIMKDQVENKLVKENKTEFPSDFNLIMNEHIAGTMKKLAEIEADTNHVSINNQFMAANNQTNYGITLNHYLSTYVNDINYIVSKHTKDWDRTKLRKELEEKLPHLFHVMGSDSHRGLLNRIIDEGLTIELVLFNGITSGSGEGLVLKDLGEANRWSMLMGSTTMKNPIYTFFRAADRTTELGFRFLKPNGVPVNIVSDDPVYQSNSEIRDRSLDYLKEELKTLYYTTKLGLGKDIIYYGDNSIDKETKLPKLKYFSDDKLVYNKYQEDQQDLGKELTKALSKLNVIKNHKKLSEEELEKEVVKLIDSILTSDVKSKVKTSLKQYFQRAAYGHYYKGEVGLANQIAENKVYAKSTKQKKKDYRSSVKYKIESLGLLQVAPAPVKETWEKGFYKQEALPDKERKGRYFVGISADIFNTYMQQAGNNYSPENVNLMLEIFLEDFESIQFDSYVQIGKLLVGDPTMFKNQDDYFKRMSMFNSTKKNSISNENTDAYYNLNNGGKITIKHNNQIIDLGIKVSNKDVKLGIEKIKEKYKDAINNRLEQFEFLSDYTISDVQVELEEGYKKYLKKDKPQWRKKFTSVIFEDIKTHSELSREDGVDKISINDDGVIEYKDADGNIIEDKNLAPLTKLFTESFVNDGITNSLLLTNKVKSYVSKFRGYEESDGQAYVTLDGYKEILMKSTDWTIKHHYAYSKIQQGLELDADELALFPVLKTQYTGPLSDTPGLYVPAGYKHSVFPLLPQFVKGTKLDKLRTFMEDNDITLANMHSANKYGTKLNKNGQIMTIYDETGDFTWDDKTLNGRPLITQETEWKWFGVQVDQAPKFKNNITVGSQFRKLVLSNIISNGVPVDYDGIDKWNELSYDDKIKASTLFRLQQEYIDIQSELIERPFDELIKELDISVKTNSAGNVTGYTINNRDALVNIIIESQKDRNIADNIIASLNSLRDEQTTVETVLNKEKVEQIMHALINSRVVREKRKGEMSPQIASSLFEFDRESGGILVSEGTRLVAQKGKPSMELASALKTYRKGANGKTLPAECIMGLPKEWNKWVEETGGLDKFNSDIDELHQKLYRIEENNELLILNDEEETLKKLLTIIGFRIPNQGLNSSDYMRIRRFLPTTFGYSVVVPSEMIPKAGSDFDIDKLNVYMANYKKPTKRGGKWIMPGYTKYSTKDNTTDDDRYAAYIDSHKLEDSEDVKLVKDHAKGLISDFTSEIKEQKTDWKEIQDANYENYKENLTKIRLEIINSNKSKTARLEELYGISRLVFDKLPRDIKQEYWNINDANEDGDTASEKLLYRIEFTKSLIGNLNNAITNNENVIYKDTIDKGIYKITSLIDRLTELNQSYKDILNDQLVDFDKKYQESKVEEKNNLIVANTEIKNESLEVIDYMRKAIELNKKRIKDAVRQYKISELNLMSFEDFSNLPIEKQNTPESLQNRMLEIQVELLEHPYNFRQLMAPISDGVLNDEDNGIVWDVRFLQDTDEVEQKDKDGKVINKFIPSIELIKRQNKILNEIVFNTADNTVRAENIKGYIDANGMLSTKDIVSKLQNKQLALGDIVLNEDLQLYFLGESAKVYSDLRAIWYATKSKEFKQGTMAQVASSAVNMKKFIEFLSGKTGGVGQTAVHITHHQLGCAVNLQLNDKNPYWIFPHNKSEDGYPSFANTYSSDKELISETLSAFLNSYVDVAKDPYIFSINAGSKTANMIFMMIRAGAPLKWIGRFLSQPIIKDYVLAQDANESIPVKMAKMENTKASIVKGLLAKYAGSPDTIYSNREQEDANYVDVFKDLRINDKLAEMPEFKHQYEQKELDLWKQYETLQEAGLFEYEKLGDYILYNQFIQDTESIPEELDHITKYYNKSQKAILDLFLEYQRQSKHLQELIKATSADTRGIPQNRAALEEDLMDTMRVLGSNMWINAEKLIDESIVRQFQKTRENAHKLYTSMYLVEKQPMLKKSQLELFNTFSPFAKDSKARIKLSDTISNDMIMALMSVNYDGNSITKDVYETLVSKSPISKYKDDNNNPISFPEFINNLRKDKAKKQKGSLIEKYWSLRDNKFIKKLAGELSETNQSYAEFVNKKQVVIGKPSVNYIKYINSKSIQEEVNADTESLQEIKEKFPEFYNDLITFAIFQNGFNNQPNTFVEKIPAGDVNKMKQEAIDRFLQLNSEQQEDLLNQFNDQFKRRNLRFNPGTKRFTNNKKITDQDGKDIGYRKYASVRISDKFELNEDETDENGNPVTSNYNYSKVSSLGALVALTKTESGRFARQLVIGTEDVNYLNFNSNSPKQSIIGEEMYFVGYDLMVNEPELARKNNSLKTGIRDRISEKKIELLEGGVKNHAMNKEMKPSENIYKESTTTLALSLDGRRTSTTRSVSLGKVGSMIRFELTPQIFTVTETYQLTKEMTEDPEWVEQWSENEGWTTDHFYKVLNDTSNTTVKVGSWVTRYKKVNTGVSSNSTIQLQPSNTTSDKTEFNKLPERDPSIKTMKYAGIGSRQTPSEILKLMTNEAKYLESLGYTLQTGYTFGEKEEGADKAFSDGTNNKVLFGPDGIKSYSNNKVYKYDYDPLITNRTTIIGKSIHPAWDALQDGGKKLMARNTNQVFGEQLDEPVDFVLFYALPGKKPIRPTGGTGQAVEMARLKGISTINMADVNWKEQLEKVLNDDGSIDESDVVEDQIMQPEIKSTTPTSNVKPENISSSGSDLAKKLTNPYNNLKVEYKSKVYKNAEHAYQTWKSGKLNQTVYDMGNKYEKPGPTELRLASNQRGGDTFKIMVEILTAKLEQHPELQKEIEDRGGINYIKRSTHNVLNDNSYWETSGENMFIKALEKAWSITNVPFSPITDKALRNKQINKAQDIASKWIEDSNCKR